MTRRTDPLAGLNDAQRQAAEAVRGPVAILAGAGTGKTTTITHRIAHQVQVGAFDAAAVLAVTFTEKAAGELKARLAGSGSKASRPARSTRRHCASSAPCGRGSPARRCPRC